MEFKQLSKRARAIKRSYDEFNRRRRNKRWGVSEYTQGFMGDAGDLVKLIMIDRGFSRSEDSAKETKRKLKHELADCLWSLLAIADELGIDLEQEFSINMDYLEQKLYETSKR